MKSVSNDLQVDKLVNGDNATLETLYKTLFPKVVIYINKNQGTYADAEEVFQDALFQTIARAKVKGLEIKSSLEAYLYVVCRNLWLQELNKQKKKVRNEGVFELKDEGDKTMECILYQDRWDLFEEKFELLTENCRKLLKTFFNKTPYSDIVKRFNYSSENVAFQRVFKCKKRLTDLIKTDVKYKHLIS